MPLRLKAGLIVHLKYEFKLKYTNKLLGFAFHRTGTALSDKNTYAYATILFKKKINQNKN